MNMLCDGRVCVVTGAARGIGRAHVETLVADSAGVDAAIRPLIRAAAPNTDVQGDVAQ